MVVRKIAMIPILTVAALVLLAVIAQAGVFVLERLYPQRGKTVDVTGATLNVVELGPNDRSSDAAPPPILLRHGATPNPEAMRKPLGELLAQHHRVILIDRPGHGWSKRDRASD